jgi:hypothetical protein
VFFKPPPRLASERKCAPELADLESELRSPRTPQGGGRSKCLSESPCRESCPAFAASSSA